jgi:hypothetical protein
MGFDSEKEFHKMVSSVDLANPIKLQAFLNWRDNDGTKKGLEKISEKHENIT